MPIALAREVRQVVYDTIWEFFHQGASQWADAEQPHDAVWIRIEGACKVTAKHRSESDETREELRNEDPITGTPGSHPVGTGIGAAVGGAAVGAAAGAVGGPIGAVVGAVAGGVAGGYGGKAVAENIDPTVENEYWREHHTSRPYYQTSHDYETYEPAYRMGWESYDPDVPFEDREVELQQRWEAEQVDSGLPWDTARPATKDAWDRLGSQRTQPKPRWDDS
jgi:hypothetical protein